MRVATAGVESKPADFGRPPDHRIFATAVFDKTADTLGSIAIGTLDAVPIPRRRLPLRKWRRIGAIELHHETTVHELSRAAPPSGGSARSGGIDMVTSSPPLASASVD